MRHQTKKFWAALAFGAGMVATAVWSAVTTVGFPPSLPSEIPWTPVLFGAFAFGSFVSLLWENLSLKTTSLGLVYEPEKGSPYVFDKQGVEGKTLRLHRVGVKNAGASASDVSVKLMKCEPLEQGTVYPGHELLPMGHPLDTLAITVHKTNGPDPLVYFDVIGQLFTPGEKSERLHIRYAAGALYGRNLAKERYRIQLAIHGSGSPMPRSFIVERDDAGHQWVLREA